MSALRRHAIARFFACVLLTWTAVDLLVPQLCDAEDAAVSSSVQTSGDDQHADCFCCSHVVEPVRVAVIMTAGDPIVLDGLPAADLVTGEPLAVYHPPLHA